MNKVVIAMSGGVDSSVAAALLKAKGYEVIGVTMQIWEAKKDFGGCCSLSAFDDARSVCHKLKIPHYVLNFRKDFKEYVVKDFINEYKNGRTPNPCVRCNQFLKFDFLLQKTKELGFDFLATGHYAIIRKEKEIYKLLKGVDHKKDQSYFLYRMNQKSLSSTLFPVGEMIKDEVRKVGEQFSLPVAQKKESQEICFIEDQDYSSFLKERVPEYFVPGDILDKDGKVVGRHNGVLSYTIGQKKGIGSHKERKYVIKIDTKNNSIIIGNDSDLFQKSFEADNVSYTGEALSSPMEVDIKIRYNGSVSKGMIYPSGDKASFEFLSPQRAVTPGQSVVFYKGDEVLGGALIL